MNVEYVESEELSRESIELVSVDSYHTGSEDKNNYLYSDDTSYIYYYRSEDDRIHHGLLPMESTHIITECTQAPYLDIIQEKEIRHCRWLIFGDVRFRHNTRYEAHIPEGSIAG
ncbi:hypothetical protein IKG60_00515 [Candidatus Saccharibacteria bacterium]|nr:hypothetical protein [Candidatus Saccharibacteria bacterium]